MQKFSNKPLTANLSGLLEALSKAGVEFIVVNSPAGTSDNSPAIYCRVMLR